MTDPRMTDPHMADLRIRDLHPQTDRAAVEALFRAAADYIAMETGLPVDGSRADEFLTAAPPGIDPATSLRLGMFDADTLIGGAELAFGYPEPTDAYIGLMIFAPAARGRNLGGALLAQIETRARARGARRLLIAALEVNVKGRAFWSGQGFTLEKLIPDRQMGTRLHIVHRMTKAL